MAFKPPLDLIWFASEGEEHVVRRGCYCLQGLVGGEEVAYSRDAVFTYKINQFGRDVRYAVPKHVAFVSLDEDCSLPDTQLFAPQPPGKVSTG